MSAPLTKKAAVEPLGIDETDLVDRTMELDMRWLQYEKDDDSAPENRRAAPDEPTVVLDLTATQVHNLLMEKKT